MKAVTKRARTFAIAFAMILARATIGCGSQPASPPVPRPVPLHLEPACDLAPAAGVVWVVEAKPRAIAEIPDLIPAVALVLPEARLESFAKANGGIDLRQVKDLCVARYDAATLTIARTPLDPERVASTFEARSTSTVTRAALAANPRVLRLSARVDGAPEQLVVFGRDGVASERGAPGPLRASEAFAFGRLKKASPALAGAALRRVAEVLGPTPSVRAFAAGPFEGETARGLGGLMRAATAVGASAAWAGKGSGLTIRVVLTGAWRPGEAEASAAAERLAAATHVLSESPIGHLLGLHRPVRDPVVHVEADALVLDATIDGDVLARGIHDAVGADVAEIMHP